MAKPLLSFVLVAYNQEKFIRDAVESALNQTYSPLELVLSDDCSSDKTFEIIKELTSKYRGPHRIVLNRTAKNAGAIGAHINSAFSLCTGSLIIVAAGDDISHADRTAVMFNAWETAGRRSHCLQALFRTIGPNGEQVTRKHQRGSVGDGPVCEVKLSVESFFTPEKPHFYGCSMAYTPDVMKVFGALPPGLVHEDEVMAFRATCLGPVLFVNSELVDYRIHSSNSTSSAPVFASARERILSLEARSKRTLQTRIGMYSALLGDLTTALQKGLLSQSQYESSVAFCQKRLWFFSEEARFHSSGFVKKCSILWSLRRRGLSTEKTKRMIARLLPTSTFIAFKRVQESLANRN